MRLLQPVLCQQCVIRTFITETSAKLGEISVTEVSQDNDVRNYGDVDETDAEPAADNAITDEVVVDDEDDDDDKMIFEASGLDINPEHIFEHALNNKGNVVNDQQLPHVAIVHRCQKCHTQ